MIRFTVYGIPAPQGSKAPWGSESNPNTRPWRAAVAATAAETMSHPHRHLLVGPLAVRAEFIFPRPKAHYRTGKHADVLKPAAPHFHTSKPDADKLARAIGDSLTGIIMRDDSQIVDWRIIKRYGEPARVELEIDVAA